MGNVRFIAYIDHQPQAKAECDGTIHRVIRFTLEAGDRGLSKNISQTATAEINSIGNNTYGLYNVFVRLER
jgi:hypothetical protein